jgi:phosphoribosylaminoimidazole carboxylase (NCAIR synthetase)
MTSDEVPADESRLRRSSSSPVVGIVGGGQLGRMMCLAGIPLGLRFRILDPAPEAATDPVAERVIGEFDDFAALAEFVRGVDVITYEFENVPVGTTRWLAERVPVYPPPTALEVAQDRILEKRFLVRAGVPVAERLAGSATTAKASACCERLRTWTRPGGYLAAGR